MTKDKDPDAYALISVKLSKKLRKRFKTLCMERDTNMSCEIGLFVARYVQYLGNVTIDEGKDVEQS